MRGSTGPSCWTPVLSLREQNFKEGGESWTFDLRWELYRIMNVCRECVAVAVAGVE
jgi:hypothetical protein